MLFYEREEWVEASENVGEKICKPFERPSDPNSLFLSSPSYHSVWKDNEEFDKLVQSFDSTYFQFVEEISKHSLATKAEECTQQVYENVRVSVKFFTNIVLHVKDTNLCKPYFSFLKTHLPSTPHACKVLLSVFCSREMLSFYLLKNRVTESRELLSTLLIDSLRALHKEEPLVDANPQKESTLLHLASKMVQVVQAGISSSWRNFVQFFSLLHSFASLSPLTSQFLVQSRLIGSLVHLYLGRDSPKNSRPAITNPMSTKTTEPDFSSLISLLVRLTTCCMTDGCEEGPLETMVANTNFVMSSECNSMLLSPNFLSKLCQEVNIYSEGLSIFTHLSFNSKQGTFSVMQGVLKAISNAKEKQMPSVWMSAEALLGIVDEHQEGRTKYFINNLFEVLARRQKEKYVLRTAHAFLSTVAKDFELVMEWLSENKEWYEWLESCVPSPDNSDIDTDELEEENEDS